jgi:threonylcarbamoyladenosine tRNA methylthiotransferase MtaB
MKAHLRMLGCRLNQAEIEGMARQFAGQGHAVVDAPQDADVVIVNTCAVTRNAERDSRKLIREIARANPGAAITVTGCYAHLAPDEVAALPGVQAVVSNTDKDGIVAELTALTAEGFDQEPLQREAGRLAYGHTRAFLKVQDGCDQACTFCITTVARGASVSRPLAAIVDEINLLAAAGYQEVVLTGVHLGSYGHDLAPVSGLGALLEAILARTSIARVRLSSLEPWDIEPEFFDLWADPRLMPHLHLPLQSGSDRILRRMRRRTTWRDFASLVAAARERIPDVRITSDVIVGFPGETDTDFAASLANIRAMGLDGMHIFRYSVRPGTPASRMSAQIPSGVMAERSRAMHTLRDQQVAHYTGRFLGTTRPVLWEAVTGASPEGFLQQGYTDNYLRVTCLTPEVLTNRVTAARLLAADSDTVTAEAMLE